MFRPLPVAAAVAVLISSGLVHGLWTNRWHNPEALAQACARVGQVPLSAGLWKGQTLGPPEVDAAAFAKAGAQAYWMRRYVNEKEGIQVTAILMCGPQAEIAVHPPEVCYTASGYEMTQAPTPLRIEAPWPAEFRTSEFASSRTEAGSKRLRIFWSWNASGEWLTPSGDARWTFHGAPFLYKLYVVHEVRGPAGPAENDPGVALLRGLLPEMQATLFPSREDAP